MISKFASQISYSPNLSCGSMDTRQGEVRTHAFNFKGKVVREILWLYFVSETSLKFRDDFKICFINFHYIPRFAVRFDVKNS
jgi:hypothetical protein